MEGVNLTKIYFEYALFKVLQRTFSGYDEKILNFLKGLNIIKTLNLKLLKTTFVLKSFKIFLSECELTILIFMLSYFKKIKSIFAFIQLKVLVFLANSREQYSETGFIISKILII
jgi:hypothetical protein